jgi:hypothetical protein
MVFPNHSNDAVESATDYSYEQTGEEATARRLRGTRQLGARRPFRFIVLPLNSLNTL